jgi:ribonucleoside-diphosphate reductase beta chain
MEKTLSSYPAKKGMFEPQISRKPDHYPWTKEFMESMWKGFWTADEFNFTSDYSQFKTVLSPQEQSVIVNALSAIGQIEVAVKTFWANIGNTLPHPSIRDLGYVLGHNEVIHNMAYEKLLTVLGLEDVFEKNLENPVVKGRVDYLRKYAERIYDEDDRRQFIYSIALFTMFVEGVSLFSQFYIIMNMNRHNGYMKDTAQQVRYTRQEEMIHLQVGIKIINTLRKEYPELFDEEMISRIKEECLAAIVNERKVIEWILGDYETEEVSVDILDNFVRKKIADALGQIGIHDHGIDYDKDLLKVTKWFEDGQQGVTITDFFASRPVEYSKGEAVDVDDLF